MRRRRLAAAAIFLALAAAAVVIRARWPSPAIVFCDNGTDDDVVISRDGAVVATVPHHDFRALLLAPGEHRLEARAGGRVIDVEPLDAARGQRWMWNVAGAQRYAV